MPAPPQPEPAPRTLNAKATVSVILTVVGIAMMVAASAGLWGGWAAMFTAGFAVSLMAVLVGWDT